MKEAPDCARCDLPASSCECKPLQQEASQQVIELRRDLGFSWQAAAGNWHPGAPHKQPATVADVLRARNYVARTVVQTGRNLGYMVAAPVAFYLAFRYLAQIGLSAWYFQFAAIFALLAFFGWFIPRQFPISADLERSEKKLEELESSP